MLFFEAGSQHECINKDISITIEGVSLYLFNGCGNDLYMSVERQRDHDNSRGKTVVWQKQQQQGLNTVHYIQDNPSVRKETVTHTLTGLFVFF